MCATTATNIPSSPEKTVVLFGSPRTDGATGTLADLYLSTLTGELIMIDCFHRAVAPCDDCRACHTVTRCAKRDMDDVYQAIEQADKLVFITPVYNRSFPAPMKAMIDRLQCYWAKRFVHGIRPPVERAKTAVLLTVCGSDRDDGECLQHQLEPPLTVLHVTALSAVHVRGCDGEVDWNAVAEQLQTI